MDGRQSVHGDMPVQFTGEVPGSRRVISGGTGASPSQRSPLCQQQHPLAGGYCTDETVEHQ